VNSAIDNSDSFGPGVTVTQWLEQHRHLPHLEREWLLCHHLGLDRSSLLTHPEQTIDSRTEQQLDAHVLRLSKGEPLAYLLGERGFWDFTLTVSPAVLVPRPETETLVEQALVRTQSGDRVLDLGTGSGAIAIALSREIEAREADVWILAVDRSEAALEIARDNANRLAPSVEFRLSDWFQQIGGTFNVIVANPPYVAEADPHLPDLAFEPQTALVSGPDGLDDLRTIIGCAPDHLLPGGWLLVEHGYDQAADVERLFGDTGFENIELIEDLGGQPRVTAGRRKDTGHG